MDNAAFIKTDAGAYIHLAHVAEIRPCGGGYSLHTASGRSLGTISEDTASQLLRVPYRARR